MSETNDKVTCPKCQAINFTTSAVCWQCGEPLRNQDETAAAGPPITETQAPQTSVYGANIPPPVAPYTAQPTPATYAAKPPNHLVWAIPATLCCCMPAGVVSIVYAAQVDSKYNAADYAGARDASDKAKLWAWVSFGVGMLSTVAYGVMGFLGALGSGSGNFFK